MSSGNKTECRCGVSCVGELFIKDGSELEMGNFKIKVNSEAESKEAQELFFQLGYGFEGNTLKETQEFEYTGVFYLFAYGDDQDLTHSSDRELFNSKIHKEVTLPELRLMVKPSLKDQYLEQAKKINDACASVFKKQDDLLTTMLNQSTMGINDQYAEIEQVRQAIKVPDGNDSDHAEDAMSYGFMGVGTKQVRQHRHYFIDVSDVDEIDFYEIALRYNVTDPCIQHILKKCLAVGQRGQKDFHHDLKDIYDTAKRMLDVHGLDS